MLGLKPNTLKKKRKSNTIVESMLLFVSASLHLLVGGSFSVLCSLKIDPVEGQSWL